MTPKTSMEYQKLAEHFLKTKVNGELTLTNIKAALVNNASHYRPAYWRRLRRAIKHTLNMKGNKKAAGVIGSLKNPITIENSKISHLKKAKQKRVKQVIESDHNILMSHFKERSDYPLMGALYISWLLGCRPSEMPYLQLLDDQHVCILGAKKTDDGSRGMDRTLQIDATSYKLLEHSIVLLNIEIHKADYDPARAIHRLQRRLQTATKSIWPKKKHHISFYSYRHQMGSNLKSSGMTAEAIAAFMGHQSVNSIDSYGDKRAGKSKALPCPTQVSIASVRNVTPKPFKLKSNYKTNIRNN